MNKELINDLIITALEGGSNYWYILDGNVLSSFRGYKISPSDSITDAIITAVLDYDREIIIYDAADENEKLGVLNMTNINEAIELFKDDYPNHYADAVNEGWDADTSDVFFQLIVMKDIIFG